MKTKAQRLFAAALFIAMLPVACLDRDSSQICPTHFESAAADICGCGSYGVDLLVVVDKSPSMMADQETLTQGIYTLVNTLSEPNADNWEYLSSTINEMRLAVVSSDLGLLFGEEHTVGQEDGSIIGCTDPDGDNGELLTVSGTGEQCLDAASNFAQQDWDELNAALADQAACMASQDGKGCEVEQPLEAALLALEKHPDFLDDDHILAVVVISNEDDYSIADEKLFETAEWQNTPNTAFNHPETSSPYLFPVERYLNKLREIKYMSSYMVFFGAVIGVPVVDACQGSGDALEKKGCLDLPEMQIVPEETGNETEVGFAAIHPVCTRTGETHGAAPARRLVDLAERFEDNSYVSSICNDDFNTIMKNMASRIWDRTYPLCWPKKMNWTALKKDQQPKECTNGNCGTADCNLNVQILMPIDDTEDCPMELYEGLSEEERRAYLDQKTVTPLLRADGTYSVRSVSCALPKLPLPLDCREAYAMSNEIYRDKVGWYYCETPGENFKKACWDNNDNDGDGLIDCDDDDCAGCAHCGGDGTGCAISPACPYEVRYTPAAKRTITGFVETFCPVYSDPNDENCE